MNFQKSLSNGIIIWLLIWIAGCSQTEKFYDDGMDTVQHFGNGRFQVAEPSPKSYCLLDAKVGSIADGIVSWRERGQFAYIIGANPQRFYLIDLPSEQIKLYTKLKQVPATNQPLFKAMFGK